MGDAIAVLRKSKTRKKYWKKHTKFLIVVKVSSRSHTYEISPQLRIPLNKSYGTFSNYSSVNDIKVNPADTFVPVVYLYILSTVNWP